MIPGFQFPTAIGLIAGVAVLIGLCGCSAIPGSQEFVKRSFITPSTGDYDDDTDEGDDSWIRQAGIEARGDRPIEKENDPFRDMVMSPKARSIERNLGFD